MKSICKDCPSVAIVDFDSLENIDEYGLQQGFENCTLLNTVNMKNLALAKSNSLYRAFYGCSSLSSIDFDSLRELSGSDVLRNAFYGCSFLSKVSFPSLVSFANNSFCSSTTASYLTFNNCSNLTEIHFRADVQSQVEAMTGYSKKWGATNATIYFDL